MATHHSKKKGDRFLLFNFSNAKHQNKEVQQNEKQEISVDDNKKFNQILDEILTDIRSNRNINVELDGENDDEIKNTAINYVTKLLTARNYNKQSIEAIAERFASYMWGFYILDEYIKSDEVFDIKCHSYNHIRIKKVNGKETAPIQFADKADYERFIRTLALRNQISLSDLNAEQTFTDKYSSHKYRLRFTLATKFINSNETFILEIRKIPKEKLFIEDLIKKKMLSQENADFLINEMCHGTGMAIFGKPGSGKTFLYNALIEEYPHNKSGLIAQENEELFAVKHPDMIFQHIVRNNGESKIEYTLAQLTRFALLFDVEFIGLGEIKDKDEATELSKCIQTGVFGMLTSHGETAINGYMKLADYVKQGTSHTYEDCLKSMSSLRCLVHLSEFGITEIIRLHDWNEEKHFYDYEYIYKAGEKK